MTSTFASRVSLPALVAITFWGASFVATRVALGWLSPMALVAGRLVIGFAVLVVLGRWLWPGRVLCREDRPRCVLLGVVLAAHILVQNIGLQWTTASNTGWIVGFMPASIALGAAVFLKERLPVRGWIGIATGAAGVLLVCLSAGLRLDAAKLGDLLQCSSCITWTAFTLLSVKPIQRSGATVVTMWTIGVAGLVMLVASAAGSLTGAPFAAGSFGIEPLAALVFLGAVCSGAAFALWNHAVRTIGSPATGAYLYLEPFVTLIAARLILGEPVRGLGLVGGVVVLVGVWVVSGARRRTPAEAIRESRRTNDE